MVDCSQSMKDFDLTLDEKLSSDPFPSHVPQFLFLAWDKEEDSERGSRLKERSTLLNNDRSRSQGDGGENLQESRPP